VNYVFDTFSAPANTRLDQYDGDLNADWQRVNTTEWGNLIRINSSQRLTHTSENPNYGSPSFRGSHHWLTNYDMPTASYVVEADFYNAGVFSEYESGGPGPLEEMELGGPGGGSPTVHPNGTVTQAGYLRPNMDAQIGGRSTLGNYNGYNLLYNQLNAQWQLRKFIAGVAQTVPGIQTYFDIIPVGVSRKAQLVMAGYWIEGWIDGVCRLRFRDEGVNSFSDPGELFLRFDHFDADYTNNEFPTKGIHLDNFRVHDEFPPRPLPQELMLFGSGNSSGQVSLNWTE
jgi:hypothetical protein